MPKTKTVRAKKGHTVKAAAPKKAVRVSSPKAPHLTQTISGSTSLLVLAVLSLILITLAGNLF